MPTQNTTYHAAYQAPNRLPPILRNAKRTGDKNGSSVERDGTKAKNKSANQRETIRGDDRHKNSNRNQRNDHHHLVQAQGTAGRKEKQLGSFFLRNIKIFYCSLFSSRFRDFSGMRLPFKYHVLCGGIKKLDDKKNITISFAFLPYFVQIALDLLTFKQIKKYSSSYGKNASFYRLFTHGSRLRFCESFRTRPSSFSYCLSLRVRKVL